MSRNSTILIIGAFTVGIILFLLFSGGDSGNILEEKNDVECTARVDGDDVKSVNCQVVGNCRVSGLSIAPQVFGIGEQNIKVEMLADGKVYDSKKVTISFGRDQNIGLNFCVPKNVNQGVVRVVNENGGVEDSASVSW